MADGLFRCVGCRSMLPEREIGITGQCRECWQKRLEEHDTLMRTIIWRETGELVPAGKYKEAIHMGRR